jgi:hypothetical protein
MTLQWPGQQGVALDDMVYVMTRMARQMEEVSECATSCFQVVVEVSMGMGGQRRAFFDWISCITRLCGTACCLQEALPYDRQVFLGGAGSQGSAGGGHTATFETAVTF